MRLDQYVTEKLDITRNKAQAVIKAESVMVNSKVITKTGFKVKETDIVEIQETEESRYVARSAMKLKWYFYKNNTQVDWKVCLDIWSSTWGFSQILLENNASKIYAVDVWTSQLHDIVRADKRVISLENTDIRNLKLLPEKVDIITCDVSFIKLDMILSAIKLHIWEGTRAFLLFKPQFEVWKSHVNGKWVVKDEKFTIRELNNFLDICRANELKVINVEKSQMKWENWNEEIFIELINK